MNPNRLRRLAVPALAVAIGAALAFVVPTVAQQPAASQPAATAPAVDVQALSYGMGFQIGAQLKAMQAEVGVTVDQATMLKGLDDARAGRPVAYDQAQVQAAFAALQESARSRAAENFQRLAETNATAAKAFLAEQAKKPNVKATGTGLLVETVAEGTGPTPAATDTVRVHYVGTFADGNEFDSSRRRGPAATFPLAEVARGFADGITRMKVGGRSKLYIPPELFYGDRGGPNGNFPPNVAVVFDVELLAIEAGAATTQPAGAAATTRSAERGDLMSRNLRPTRPATLPAAGGR